jgi:hypothetical protein
MAEVLAFDPHRARTYLHGLRGEAHLYAWHYFRWRTGKRRVKPLRPRAVAEGMAEMIRDAVNIGLGRKAAAAAPAKFIGWQERPGGKPPIALYNMRQAIPGHPKGSTVSQTSLVREGFTLPRTPAPNPRGDPGLIWTGGNPRGRGRRRANAPSTTTILDFLAEAVNAELRGDPNGWSWVWFYRMTAIDRLGFDLFLVKMRDPLAYEAGTPENRFRRRVLAMVQAERERRDVKPNPMSAAARKRYPGIARLQDDVAAVYRRGLEHYRGDKTKARALVDVHLAGQVQGERARRRRTKSNPPRARAGGGARLIYPAGRIVGTWYGRHRNGKLYKHRFGRGLKSVYGLPGGDLILSGHQGRLWKTIF